MISDQGKENLVIQLISFQKYVQYDFTADLENQLDEISDGKLNWIEVINNFWKNFCLGYLLPRLRVKFFSGNLKPDFI